MLRDPDAADIRSELEDERNQTSPGMAVVMRGISECLVLATILVVCSAVCRSGLNGRQDWYRCEGLTNLELQIPSGAVGIAIDNSSIAKIPTGAFSLYGDTLEELNITGCGVEEIEPNAFAGLGKLRVLSLTDNRIRRLDASWLRDLSGLRALSVWRNRIAEVDPQLYDLLANMQIWDIAHNELIACLPPDLLKKLTKLRRIYIAGNPWSYRCRASMTWYLGSNHIRFIQDWGASDLLLEECLAHEPRADVDDGVLSECVARKIVSADTLPYVAGLNERIRELARRVTELEADIIALRKTSLR